MRFIHPNKGFTLIELLLVLALTSVVMVPLSTFFISNLKTFHRADDQIEVQHHAQIAMNEIIDKVMWTKGILNIEYYDSGNHVVKSMTFDNSSVTDDTSKHALIFKHKNTVKAMYYGYSSSNEIQFANYIEELKVQLLPLGSTYESCDGIGISIKGKKNNSEIILNNEVFFRNE